MSGYAPGAIGSLLKVKPSSDDLFSSNLAERLKAKPVEARSATHKRRSKENQKEAKRPKGVVHDEPAQPDSEDEESELEEDVSGDESEPDRKVSDEEKEDERAPRTIFVGNIPVQLKSEEDEADVNGKAYLKKLEKDLIAKFKSFGKVDSIRLRSLGLKSVKVPTGSDFHLVRKIAAKKGSLDERINTCNAYVVFEDESSVQQAVEQANGTEFRGNHIRVDALHEGSKGKVFDRNRTVFVGNMKFEASEEQCRKHFADLIGDDNIVSVRIIRDPRTNMGRGFGYVLLKDENVVAETLDKVHESKLQGRALRVTRCERSNQKKLAKLAHKRDSEPRIHHSEPPKRTRESSGGEQDAPDGPKLVKRTREWFSGKPESDKDTNKPGSTRRKNITAAQKAAFNPEKAKQAGRIAHPASGKAPQKQSEKPSKDGLGQSGSKPAKAQKSAVTERGKVDTKETSAERGPRVKADELPGMPKPKALSLKHPKNKAAKD